MKLLIKPRDKIKGELHVPGDKSISHRSVILGALAEGTTEVQGFLHGEDSYRTVNCFRKMGVSIDIERGKVIIEGKGLHGLQEPEDVLDAGNSGTTARLLLGILAGNPFYSVITGDSSLRSRPMGRVVEPLSKMAATFYGRKGSALLPLSVLGGDLEAIEYNSPVASAQIKSAILLAGLYARGVTSVTEPQLSRDHTERMLKHFGIKVNRKEKRVEVKGLPKMTGKKIEVPGDFSSAAFFIVAASILPGSSLKIYNVGINPTRTGLLDVLLEMGADICLENERIINEEPVADIRVESARLKGTGIGGELIPRLIDEIPVLAVAAAVAEGKTVIKDAAELKVKESDRISAVVQELEKMEAQIEGMPDGMVIHGRRELKGAVCHSQGDHRIAMAMAVAGLAARGETRITGSECINISFPGFDKALEELG